MIVVVGKARKHMIVVVGGVGRGEGKRLKSHHKDNGFEPIHWKYECQGLHLSESQNSK